IDECKEGLPGRPRVCEFDCKNTIGSFECSCPIGKMSGMLGKCVDQCNYVPNSYCNYVKGNDSFLCECKNGFAGIPTVACSPVQFCTRNPCRSDEICIDTYRSFRCDCKPGFQRGPKGCVDIDECLQSPCPKGRDYYPNQDQINNHDSDWDKTMNLDHDQMINVNWDQIENYHSNWDQV
uniref:EGF-like domain-containing protein n=1 Tax=Romanomermis culicivorax TaxID=13658 RepID=A0A915KPF2_ROMCU